MSAVPPVRLRTLISESYQLPPMRFRVGDRTVDVPRACRTAREACEAARELGATRIEFILPHRAPIVFGLRLGQWRAPNETSLEDMQRHLDRHYVNAIGDRYSAAIKRGREPASLFASLARRDLIELRQIQDPRDFAQAAQSMMQLASVNAAYRNALSEVVAPRAQISLGTVERELTRMVRERAGGSEDYSSSAGASDGAAPAPRRAPGTDSARPGATRYAMGAANVRHGHLRNDLKDTSRERERNA